MRDPSNPESSTRTEGEEHNKPYRSSIEVPVIVAPPATVRERLSNGEDGYEVFTEVCEQFRDSLPKEPNVALHPDVSVALCRFYLAAASIVVHGDVFGHLIRSGAVFEADKAVSGLKKYSLESAIEQAIAEERSLSKSR